MVEENTIAERGPAGNEVTFATEDLFFSRTDGRGVIKAGNLLFQTISGFEWEELLGAPHKVLRHEDMPKAVFWLMWDALKAGQPVGAYVKNRTKDGGFYWVFATMIAVGEDFVSVRMKPTTPLLDDVKAIYKDLRDRELAEGLSAEDSAKAFLHVLKARGYPDYASFMCHALEQEIPSRNRNMNLAPDPKMGQFVEMFDGMNLIRQEGQKIIGGFKTIEGAPKNMRIQATHLGDNAAPLGVISSNFEALVTNITSGIGPFIDALDHLAGNLGRALFLNCGCKLLMDVLDQYETEKSQDIPEQVVDDILRLQGERLEMTELAFNTLSSVLQDLKTFAAACQALKRTLSGLSIMRVMSEIESARIGDRSGSIKEVIMQLQGFQVLTQDCLHKVEYQRNRIGAVLRQRVEVHKAA